MNAPPSFAADYPAALAYWRQHGRLPTYTERWGRIPTGPRSWPERLLAAGGGPSGFASVTVTLPRLPEVLARTMPGAWEWVLMGEVLPHLAPTFGRLEWEYGAHGAGWHLHGVLCHEDIRRMGTLPHVEVYARPIRTRRQFLRACRYGNKKIRQDAPERERWAVTEALETVKCGHARLPVLGRVFGA